MCTTRPAASTTDFCGDLAVAFVIDASITWRCPVWQSRSGMPSCGSVWYQTTEILPPSPAAIHGQSTRALPGWATVIGADHVFPRSRVYATMIEFAAGVGPPLQPPLVPACRSAVSQVTYTVPSASIASAGQCAERDVPRTPSCGVNELPPAGIVL